MNAKYHARNTESDFLCHPEPQVKNVLVYRPTIRVVYMSMLAALLLCSPCFAESFTTETSYFTRASCIKESGQCTMACGKELVDYGRNIAASWDFPLNSRVRVKCGNREVICEVLDRGPSKRLYKKGRRLDLNLQAAERLGFIKDGLALVTVEKVGG